MPERPRVLFEEARDVASVSPRSAAALLRLATEILVEELTSEAKSSSTLHQRIGLLGQRGLPQMVIQALDVLRVVGNNGVHPGEIDLDERPEAALALFSVLNLVVENVVTNKRQVEALYELLPEGALEGIEKRDRPNKSASVEGAAAPGDQA